MSDTSQGPGWWQASNDKWYSPDQSPAPPGPPPTITPIALSDLHAHYEQTPVGGAAPMSATPATVPTVPTTSAPKAVPAGWYPDPRNRSQQRYWDGASWGPLAPAPSPSRPLAPAPQQPQGRGVKIAAIVAATVVVLVLISVLAALVSQPTGHSASYSNGYAYAVQVLKDSAYGDATNCTSGCTETYPAGHDSTNAADQFCSGEALAPARNGTNVDDWASGCEAALTTADVVYNSSSNSFTVNGSPG